MKLIDQLVEEIERDHAGCEDTTCTLLHALNAGYSLVAIACWASSGAASERFYKLHKKLPKTQQFLGKEYHKEADEFNASVPSIQCQCNAYVYYPEDCGFHCSNCGQTVPNKSEDSNGLVAKGKAKQDRSGFVQEVEDV